MKEVQTPQKEVSRSSKPKDSSSSSSSATSSSSHSKKPLKIAKKSLNGAFTSVFEDSSSEISPDADDSSPLVTPLNSDLISTPTSTVTNDVVSNNDSEPHQIIASKCESTGTPTSAATNGAVFVNSKKVLEDKVKEAVEEYYTAHPRADNFCFRLVLFCLTIWWLAVSALLLFDLGFLHPRRDSPPPT